MKARGAQPVANLNRQVSSAVLGMQWLRGGADVTTEEAATDLTAFIMGGMA